MELPELYLMDEQPPIVEVRTVDGIFVKQMLIAKAGTYIAQHSHTYPHLSMLAVGAVNVWRDGVDLGRFDAPRGIEIPANTMHTFMALEDNTIVYCIHNVRSALGPEIEHEHDLASGRT